MAEALGKKFAADVFDSYSAGTERKPSINLDAIRIIKQLYDINMEETQFSKLISDIPIPDIVITMGCNVKCPYVPCKYREDWGLEDPTSKMDNEFIKTARMIESKILDLKNRIANNEIKDLEQKKGVARMLDIKVSREIKINQTSSELTFIDVLGTWKARWGINRMNHKVQPGLYRLGSPDPDSPVLVTANYKMSFDMLRKELTDFDAWILVLDTKGINVWCAAGKGTFGTTELLNRLAVVQLDKVVSHKTLILPQLGAPGVSAHEVLKYSGFKVIYGPVKAKDIKEFIHSGLKASAEMRTVKFSSYDRLVLTPIELVSTIRVSLMIFGVLFLLNLIGLGPFGVIDFYAYIGAIIIGCVLTPVFLPWIPGRAFAWKGWLLGFIWVVFVNLINGWPNTPQYSLLRGLGYLLVLPSVSAYLASTFTSFSGVLKEMKLAIPAIIISIALGIVLILVNSFI
jgi:protein-tyrosine-phosphatase